MKIIKKFKENEVIPENAKYLKTEKEHDYSKTTYTWEQTPGIMGILPIFGTETLYRRVPVITVHYYEIEV